VGCTTESGVGVDGGSGAVDSATGATVVGAAVDAVVDDEGGGVELVDVVEALSGVDTSGLAS
jgi:hypothetical protein